MRLTVSRHFPSLEKRALREAARRRTTPTYVRRFGFPQTLKKLGDRGVLDVGQAEEGRAHAESPRAIRHPRNEKLNYLSSSSSSSSSRKTLQRCQSARLADKSNARKASFIHRRVFTTEAFSASLLQRLTRRPLRNLARDATRDASSIRPPPPVFLPSGLRDKGIRASGEAARNQTAAAAAANR